MAPPRALLGRWPRAAASRPVVHQEDPLALRDTKNPSDLAGSEEEEEEEEATITLYRHCLLYTSPSPRD